MSENTVSWLLQSDASIRWQTLHDLIDAPESERAAERAKVETTGWGALLLSHQDEDGQWAGGSFVPADFSREAWESEGQPWTATFNCLSQLREFGIDPQCNRIQRTVELVGKNSRWDEGGQPYWYADQQPLS